MKTEQRVESCALSAEDVFRAVASHVLRDGRIEDAERACHSDSRRLEDVHLALDC